MAWNEPGGNKDPWSRKPKGNSEVDQLMNEFSKSFKDLLGGASGGSGSGKKNTSILVAIIAVIYLLIDIESTPWIGLIVALTWSVYTLIRKKINISTDVGLFIESAFMTPFAIIAFYFLFMNGSNYFGPNDITISLWLFLAGANTLIPLGLYLHGSTLAGLGPAAMIFFLAPTGQFLLGFYYFDEPFDLNKLISFVIIWTAVAIYLRDLAKDK